MSIIDGNFSTLSSETALDVSGEFHSANQFVKHVEHFYVYCTTDQTLKLTVQLWDGGLDSPWYSHEFLIKDFKHHVIHKIRTRGAKYARVHCWNQGTAKTTQFQLRVGSSAYADRRFTFKRVDTHLLEPLAEPPNEFTHASVNACGAIYVSTPLDAETGAIGRVNQNGSFQTAVSTPLVHRTFPTSTLDETDWDITTLNGGQVHVVDGCAELESGSQGPSAAQIRIRHEDLPDSGHPFTIQFVLNCNAETTGTGARSWGVNSSDGQEGLFFEFDTTLTLLIRHAGVDTIVPARQFKGNIPHYATTGFQRFQLSWYQGNILFQVSDLHANPRTLYNMSAINCVSIATWRAFVRVENVSTKNTTVQLASLTIHLEGALHALPLTESPEPASWAPVHQVVLKSQTPDGSYQPLQLSQEDCLLVQSRSEHPLLNAEAHSFHCWTDIHQFDVEKKEITLSSVFAEDERVLFDGHHPSETKVVTLVSTSQLDSPTKDGMESVTITGLSTSSALYFETETVTLNGKTPVHTSGTWYRIHSMQGTAFGASGTNQGSIRATMGSRPLCTMRPLHGQVNDTVFTVPRGSTAILRNVSCQLLDAEDKKNSGGRIYVRVKPIDRPGNGSILSCMSLREVNGTTAVKLQGGTDVRLGCIFTKLNTPNMIVRFDVDVYPNIPSTWVEIVP